MTANTIASAAPEIIAHRGASSEAPENTIPALVRGWELAPSCEIDIHLSKDGRIVALHDFSAKRTAGLDRKIAELSLDEITRLDAGAWKDAKWKGTKIPTLAGILDILPHDKRLVIEIKVGPEILPALAKALEEKKVRPQQITLIAFDYDTIRLAKKFLPQYEAYWLCSYKKDSLLENYPAVEDLIQKTKEAGLNGLDLDEKFPIDSQFAEKVKRAGLKLIVWTVDDPQKAEKLAAAGVDGITTNRPDLIRGKSGN